MDLKLTFNEDAINYDMIRPAYPNELFEDIFAYSDLNSCSRALEIGIGTGQATVPFLNKNINVTGIDIGNNLCAFTKAKFKDYSNLTIINNDFMQNEFTKNHFDLIYCATAFHWLPETALDKCKHLLKDNGTIALFWNHPYPNRLDDESNRINREIYSKYRPSDKEQSEFSEKDCDKKISELKLFGYRNIECKLYHRVRTLTSDEYIRLLNTYSDHIAMPNHIKEQFDNDMKNSLDKIGGIINIYDTIDLYLAKK